MKLNAVLAEIRQEVLDRWFDAVVETYPPQASGFLAKQKDRFRNPLGYAISRSLAPTYDEITGGMDAEALRGALDSIVRIRSIQEFSPSIAVGFVFELKSIVRRVLGERAEGLERSGALADLDGRIDRVAMIAFDKYMECRQKLFDIRADEIRRQTVRMQDRFVSKQRASQIKGESVDDVT